MRTILRIALSIILSMSIMFVNPLTGNKYTFASEGIYFEICPNQSLNSTITITAHPDNTETCHVTISWDASWLNISPSEVNIAPGGKKDVEATINSNGLEPGDYTDKIILESNCKPSYSEIPIRIKVLKSIIQVDASSKEWEIPSFGTTNKQFTILNRLCDTVLTFHAGESSGKIELSFPDRTPIKQGERLRIPVKIKSQEFIKTETHRIYIRSFGIDVAMITLRLVPILSPPIVTVRDLIEKHVKWNQKEVIVSTHLLNSSTPLLCDRIPVCSTKMEDNNSFIQVHDPSRYLSDYKFGQVMLGTFTGTFSDGSFTLTKPVEKHYDSILDYEEIFDSSNHFKPFPVESNHFLLYIQGDSSFPPLLHEQLVMETLKPLSNLPFNRNNSHIFFPFKATSVKMEDNFSSECIRSYSINSIEESIDSLNEPMRRVLRTKETPTLWVHLSGLWHTKDGKKCLLINDKPFYLDEIKEHLMKLSILGPVVIVLDCGDTEGLKEELCSIGNSTLLDCSSVESTAVCYPFSLAKSFYEKIQDYINPKDYDINWIKLLQYVKKDCTFINGLLYSNKLECSIVERKKSLVRDNVDVIRYKIKAIQDKTKINIDNTGRSTHKETIFWLKHPIARIEPSPICPPVPLPFDISLHPVGEIETSKPILINGTVTKLNDLRGNFEVDSFFDVIYLIEVPERPFEVQEGDIVKITGTLQGETTVIPEHIEIIKKECKIGISDIDSEVYCPTCFTWNYAEEAYVEYQDLEYVLTNSGDIGAAISVSSSIKQIEGSLPINFKISWNPTSFPLPAGSTYNLGGELEIHNVPELVPEIQVFVITTTFTISPKPCPKKIVKKFMVTLCPTERTVKGRISFKNVKDKQCGIANATVRLYLRYDPECGYDRSFTVEMGGIEGVHPSAKQDLPDYSLYLETKTDSKGYYRFQFIDKDCKHEYRVIVLFKNEYMNLTYQDCSNTFFVFSDIDGVQEP
ncbi:MAG: hypothetical protein KAH01_04465, partial [Caldisericia bacterium]|nr:hypothetical protein [Caldisericia bacterium]